MTERRLILEDGTVFIGQGFGSDTSTTGEIVFNTGMTGYQEVISDPSYCSQIVTMTYPLIGNYGINPDDFEAVTPFIHGLVVKEFCEYPSNFRYHESLNEYLKANQIPGIAGIDTRKLTKIVRRHGTMKALMTDIDTPVDDLIKYVRQMPYPSGQIRRTSVSEPYVVPGRGLRIVLVDFGMKHGILRDLTRRDCHVTVVPYHYSAEEISRLKPDGIMLTNGPGDPKDVPESIRMIKTLLGEMPMFGICLGHQLLALASGADTEKMTFGHRGSNHPVKDLEAAKTFMTTQNHSYSVTRASLDETDLTLTQTALNDDTVEGVRHDVYPAFSVQYHPESSPGPEDTHHLFDDFLQMVSVSKQSKRKERYYA